MNERSFRLRALLFFYSNANLFGCALALLGPLLLFAGVIDRGWLVITVGLYGAGFLIGRPAAEVERRIADTLSVEQTLERLDAIVAKVMPHLSADSAARLKSLRAAIADVLPRLLGGGVGAGASAGSDANLFTVRETVLRYLPETLANYVALPPVFRATHVLKDGKTARDLLADQLTMLDDKMREIVANVAASDAQSLLANGRFLEMKFRQPDFLAS